ncbi:MAG TPA: AAA family ATPase, partial [Gaiellaceae bacterium]|nr:AAA family ATPase [Gaiellaceae bacterium]
MGSLPRGSVTFLFTDIEGSTRLVRELGDGYARVLDDHRRLLERAAVDGVLFGTAGDACFFAFDDAGAAVEAAVRAQRALADCRVSVRMVIHTGNPLLVGGDYVGLDVHRAARVCDAANGGHVLLTEAAARAAGADTVDLGEHRLKDLPELQRLHQLALPGLARESAPLRLPAARLAPAGEALLGRERELAALRALLERERLVTLVGPAGVGKTRLALAVAAVETGRVEVVELATVNDPDAVPAAVGDAELADALLVLDNFEQLLDGAAHVAELLRRHEGLRVL